MFGQMHDPAMLDTALLFDGAIRAAEINQRATAARFHHRMFDQGAIGSIQGLVAFKGVKFHIRLGWGQRLEGSLKHRLVKADGARHVGDINFKPANSGHCCHGWILSEKSVRADKTLKKDEISSPCGAWAVIALDAAHPSPHKAGHTKHETNAKT
jgi:hypothetical protein